jgi:hypothetical protein
MQNPNNVRNADLDVILTTMAVMAHEIDHNMIQAQQLQAMEAFGALIDTALAGQCSASSR